MLKTYKSQSYLSQTRWWVGFWGTFGLGVVFLLILDVIFLHSKRVRNLRLLLMLSLCCG